MTKSTPTAARRGVTRAVLPLTDSTDAVDVVYRPVRAGNAFEETVERLLSVVKLGLVERGERLPPERELASRLEVSRMTLREAIRALQLAGYVESRRGRQGGTFVTDQFPHFEQDALPHREREQGVALADALAFREVVEVGAAALAARRQQSPPERDHLTRRLEECAGESVAGYRRSDSRFHLAIAEATGSSSIVGAVADARMRINDLLDRIPLLQTNLTHSNEQHRAIVGAILARDEAAARQAMADHLSGTAALLRAFLD